MCRGRGSDGENTAWEFSPGGQQNEMLKNERMFSGGRSGVHVLKKTASLPRMHHSSTDREKFLQPVPHRAQNPGGSDKRRHVHTGSPLVVGVHSDTPAGEPF